jgi:hypothetical protein
LDTVRHLLCRNSRTVLRKAVLCCHGWPFMIHDFHFLLGKKGFFEKSRQKQLGRKIDRTKCKSQKKPFHYKSKFSINRNFRTFGHLLYARNMNTFNFSHKFMTTFQTLNGRPVGQKCFDCPLCSTK